MKIEITKAQLKSIQDGIDTLSAMVGGPDQEFNQELIKAVRAWDRMLKKNNLPPRDYN